MSGSHTHRRRRRLGAFWRADSGATAIEFAFISVPFTLMLFGILELAMLFLTSSVLEGASEAAARRIRTGEFQQSGASAKADFKTMVCQGMLWMQSACASDLYVDVRTYGSFNAMAGGEPQAGDAFNPNATCFTTGQPTDIVLVRTYFKWKLFTPLMDAAMENMGDGSGVRLLNTATAFRNEPYSDAAPVGASC